MAGTWVRVGCYVADQAVAFILAAGISAIALAPFSNDPSSSGRSRDDPLNGVAFLVICLVYLAYFAGSYHWLGRTIGMRLGRLYVVGIDSGGNLSWGRALLRALVLGIGSGCGLMTIIWVAVTATSASKQGPHDSAARSVVLQRVK